jgi:predicted transposase YbfD/YdcC
LSAASALLDRLPALDGKIITADALHCQRAHATTIVEKGGDYLLQVKANQENLFKKAQALDGLKNTPFLPTSKPGTGA